MKIKPGVRIHGMRVETMLIIFAAIPIWAAQGAELVITSGVEGRHTKGSDHYKGDAFDLRTRDLEDPRKATRELQEALGEDFQVIFEGNHTHAEYDPQRGYGSQV